VTEKPSQQTLEEEILQVTREQKPATVSRLITLIRQQHPSLTKREVADQIIKMQNEGKLTLNTPPPQTKSLKALLKTTHATWYWLTLATVLLSLLSIFLIPENATPLIYIRNILGTIFLLWLPGYTFIRALFPIPPAISHEKNEKLDSIERIALSLGTSFALDPIVGLLLNYTPWGITLTPLTLSLAALTLTFATAAIIRENQARKQTQPSTSKI